MAAVSAAGQESGVKKVNVKYTMNHKNRFICLDFQNGVRILILIINYLYFWYNMYIAGNL